MNREIPRLSPEQVEIVRQRLLTYPPGVSAYAWGSGPMSVKSDIADCVSGYSEPNRFPQPVLQEHG